MNSGQVAASRTQEEVANAIRKLSPADWARLKKVASYYARSQIGPEDLLQEAFARALDGRVCPAHVDVVKFLAEAMRSIAHGEGKKVANRLPTVSIVSKTGDPLPAAMDCPDPAQTAEEALLSEEAADGFKRELLSEFDDDLVAKDIVEGITLQMDTSELIELSGLDQTAYASKRRFIRRRIDKKYPGGWRP